MPETHSRQKMLEMVLGIFLCFLLYGIIQKIYHSFQIPVTMLPLPV